MASLKITKIFIVCHYLMRYEEFLKIFILTVSLIVINRLDLI